MTRNSPTKIARYLLAAFALFGGCAEEEAGPVFVQVGPPTTALPSDDPAPACEAFDLCTRTIDMCEVNMSVEQCTDWYEDPATCADLAGYLECNCQCIGEEVCDDYFACGQFCFDDFC